jgi:hypothetical protein
LLTAEGGVRGDFAEKRLFTAETQRRRERQGGVRVGGGCGVVVTAAFLLTAETRRGGDLAEKGIFTAERQRRRERQSRGGFGGGCGGGDGVGVRGRREG